MILTREQILNLNEAIVAIEKIKSKEMSKYFILSICNIKTSIKSEVENIVETFKPSDEFKKFEFERDLIIQKYAVIKPDGTYNFIGSKVEIQDGKLETFKKENQVLIEKYSEPIKIRQKEIKDFNDVLKTTIELPINTIKFEILPEFISKDIFDWLLPILILPESND